MFIGCVCSQDDERGFKKNRHEIKQEFEPWPIEFRSDVLQLSHWLCIVKVPKCCLLQPANWALAAATLNVPSKLPPCRVNAYRRSSLWIKLCLRIYAIYPLLQWQNSSGWVDKSIQPKFRRPRFEFWLDLLSSSSSRDIAKYLHVTFLYLSKMSEPSPGRKHEKQILRITQCTNNRLVPYLAIMIWAFQWYQYCKNCNLCSKNITTFSLANIRSISPVDVRQFHKVALATIISYIRSKGVLGHCIDAEIYLQGRNRHWCMTIIGWITLFY